MTFFPVLFLFISAYMDYPVVETSTQATLEEIRLMPFSQRQEFLHEMQRDFVQTDFGSGPFIVGHFDAAPGELFLVTVHRSLTPSDLALLDRTGLWPTGYSPSSDSFVAEVHRANDFSLLTGSGFAANLRRWTWQDAVAVSGSPSAGGWLVQMAPGASPPSGTQLYGDLWLSGGPVENGALYAFPDNVLHARSHSVSPEADDSREVAGLPGLWSYYTGLGVRVGVLDTGVWQEHPDLQGAVFSGPPDPDGHGTAVCGVIASRGGVELFCEHQGSGGSPDAELYVIQRPSSFDPGQLAGFLGEFTANGCVIANNSWGFDGNTSYDGFCMVVDEWARDGGFAVFSSGNDPSPGQVPSPAVARNAITAGAVTFIPENGSNVVLASYSGRGPTEDGRMKPEILAPGGEYTGSSMQNGVAVPNAFYGGDWLDDPQDRWPGEPLYTRRTGTSMAAAFVSAALAICQEKYADLFGPEDARALMTACAIPLKGGSGTPETGYADSRHGFGLLDGYHLPGTYFSEEVDRMIWINSTIVEGQGDKEWVVYVPAYSSWISVGLGYMDVPSPAPDLQVNLDLTLIAPDNSEYTYHLPSGVFAESPVERVVVEQPSPGAWTVRVSASQWADPGNPSEQQRFAIAAYRFSRDPELSVTFPRDTTIYAPPGGELTIPVTVINSGGYVAVGTWALLDPPGVFTGDVNVPAFLGNLLYKNASSSAEFTLQCPNQPGTHQVSVLAGGANRGLEDATSQFTIVLAYPDLTVSIPSPDTPPPFQVGQNTGFSTVVSNDGLGPAPATDMVYYLTHDPDSLGEPVLEFAVPPLESGATAAFKGSYTFTYFDMGTRYLVAVVDPDSTVQESDKTNNTAVYGPFQITGEFAPPANLVAESGNNGFIPLSWEPPQAARGRRDSRGLVAYRLYRSITPLGPQPEPIAEIQADSLSWTDTRVVNGVTYFYWITSVYSEPSGESPLSNMASATAQGPTGSLGGIVTDVYTGRNLPDIIVSISGLGVEAVTDNTGYYYLSGVPVGPVPLMVDQSPYMLFTDTAMVQEDAYTDFSIGLVRVFSPGMTVIPTPFTPNGDGINDTASFVWPAAQGAVINLTVHNLSGVPVRTISSPEPIWDGRDDTGQPVPSGVYVFHAASPVGEVTGTVCVAR